MSLFLRWRARLVCTIVLLLPFRWRGPFATLLAALGRMRNPSESGLYRLQVRFWNTLVLGMVFYLGFPIVRLLAPLWAPGRLSPPPGSPSYWRLRRTPEELERDVSEPF